MNPTDPRSLSPARLQTERLRGEDDRELRLQLPQARATCADFRYAEERIFQLSQVADVEQDEVIVDELHAQGSAVSGRWPRARGQG